MNTTENKSDWRKPEIEAQLKEIYKEISQFLVVKSGVVTVDTDSTQSGLYFCTGAHTDSDGWNFKPSIETDFLNNPTQKDIHNTFYMLEKVFQVGVQIGVREILRLVKKHIAIHKKEKENIYHLKKLLTGLKDISFNINAHGLLATFIDDVTYFDTNKEFFEKYGDNIENIPYEEAIEGRLDITMKGDGEYFNFSPGSVLEALDAFWEKGEDSE